MLFLLCLNTASPWDREVESVSLDQKAPKSMDDAASETVDDVVQKQPHIGVSSSSATRMQAFPQYTTRIQAFLGPARYQYGKELATHLIDPFRLIDP